MAITMTVAARTNRKSSTHRPARTIAGFSLVELLVAMAIGLILISGMISVFGGNRRSSELNQAMSNMQESARFAIEAISRDARMAGFQGCMDLNTAAATPIGNGAPTSDLYSSATTGAVITSATNWIPAPHSTFTIPTGDLAPIPGTHALTLQYGSAERATLVTGMTSPADNITISATDEARWGLNGDELMIIANCDFADLFKISGIATAGANKVISHTANDNTLDGAGIGNLTADYGNEAISTAELMLFASNIYFIGNTGITNDNGDPIRALYRQSLPYTNPPLELIQGIENLRIRFGVRQANGQVRYFLPNAPGFNPGEVESVQIGILMSSWEHAASDIDEATYTLAGQAIAPNTDLTAAHASGLTHAADRRLRLAFNTTVNIRNRRNQ